MSQKENITEVIFPVQLRAAMKACGYTQEKLAHDIGVSQATIFKWLNGTHPKARPLLRASELLKVSPWTLLDGVPDPQHEQRYWTPLMMEGKVVYNADSKKKIARLAELAKNSRECLDEIEKITSELKP